MSRSIDRWASLPGGYDSLNTFYQPELATSGFPIIQAQDIATPSRLIPYGIRNARVKSTEAIHFFLDDYRFENVWRYAHRTAKAFQGLTVCSPDFSMYTDWPIEVQRWNVYRSRWCGAYWQTWGAQVIPTVNWSTPESYGFCFDGLPVNSMVAIGALEMGSDSPLFKQGFDEMIARLSPSVVLCYGKFAKAYGREDPRVVEYEPVRQMSSVISE